MRARILFAKCAVVAAAIFLLGGPSAYSQNVQHLSVPQPGGMPGMPVMTGIVRATNGMTVSWDGPAGYYQLQQKSNLEDSKWVAVGKATNLVRRATITPLSSNAFFRVSGPASRYAGAQVCAECHAAIHTTELRTAHAGAFTNAAFVAGGGQTNGACLVCHTVGYGLPTGFVSKSKTPLLAGVQCESCHGPAAPHAANPDDPIAVPRVELAATVCGGCHTGSMQPTYDEWLTSGHAEVVAEALDAMNSSTTDLNNCGRCHSESVRWSLLKGIPLPVGDANVSLGCVTCHDPHQVTANPAQLRNPVASTADYSITASGNFTNQYNAGINICGQCHNDLASSWTNSIAPPHHSPQYNMLLGTVGVLDTTLPPNQPGSHALLVTNQCVQCHMQTADSAGGQPANTGHSFRIELYDTCLQCHPFMPEALAAFTKAGISNQIQQVKSDLDLWATSKAPDQLRTNYLARAWEYTTPGDLSPGGPGPTDAEQALIPENIRKARYNLYVVLYDGSYGIHNINFATTLLETAESWIREQLNQ